MARAMPGVALLLFLVLTSPPPQGDAELFRQPPGSPFAACSQPHGMTAADFNSDGCTDVAVACRGDHAVAILFGDGRGGLRRAPRLVRTESVPEFVVAGDFNEDGNADLVVAQHDGGFATTLLGDGKGGFPGGSGVLAPEPARQAHTHALLVIDFNRDGHLDLVIANAGVGKSAAESISMLLGDGKARFADAPGSPFLLARTPAALAAADLTGDGRLDLVSVNEAARDVTVVLTGDPGQRARFTHHPIAQGRFGHSLAVGDWDADGHTDLAMTVDDTPLLLLWFGDGTGAFPRQQQVALDRRCFRIVAANFTTDKAIDLAMSCDADTALVLRGDGQGSFRSSGRELATGRGPLELLVVDLNSDSRPDLVVANRGGNNLSMFLSQPIAGNAPVTAPAQGEWPAHPCMGHVGPAEFPPRPIPVQPAHLRQLRGQLNPPTRILQGKSQLRLDGWCYTDPIAPPSFGATR